MKNGAPDLTRVDQQIEKAKARLSALYAKRREVIAASKPPKRKRISSQERIQQVAALALAGASMEGIVKKVQLSEATIRYYLYRSVSDIIREEFEDLPKDDTTTWEAKEFEVKTRIYPSIKWRVGASKPRIASRPIPIPWTRQRIMYRNNDGSIMGYFYSDGTPAPDKAENA